MKRPDIDAIEKTVQGIGKTWATYDTLTALLAYIRHLESNQPKDGEPYVIDAGQFDPETMERENKDSRHHQWVSISLESPLQRGELTFDPDKLIVVRNKVKPEPRFVVKEEDGAVRVYGSDHDRAANAFGWVAEFARPHEAQAYADWKNAQENGEPF
jgi:hypothetical protein